MKVLCLNTSFEDLTVCLIDENEIIEKYSENCNKRQSEYIVLTIQKLLEQAKWNINELEGVVVTVGPGSFTGIRIAITVAKIIATLVDVKLYTLSTLQLYAGIKDCVVIKDAKANRVYYGKYSSGSAVISDKVINLDDLIISDDESVIGDSFIVNKTLNESNLVQNFVELRNHWLLVDDVDSLAPVYLKDESAYK